MLTGYWLLKFLDGLGTAIRLRAQWLAFTVLTVLHMFANFRAVRALELNTMNEESMRFAWRAFSRRSKVATPAEYAMYELSFPAYFVDSLKDGWLSQGKVKVDVDFGCPLTDLFDGGDHSMSWDLSDPINENFFINVSLTETGARIHVSLRGGLSEEDRLRAFIQAESIKEQLSSRQQKLDKEVCGGQLAFSLLCSDQPYFFPSLLLARRSMTYLSRQRVSLRLTGITVFHRGI